MRMLKSRKGFKTIITVVALLFIALTFIVFAFLFKLSKDPGKESVTASFASIDTELALKTFLQTPSKDAAEDIGMRIADIATEADLLTYTCDSLSSTTHAKFKREAKEFFDKLYKDKWHLSLIYYSPDGDDKVTAGEVVSEHDIGYAFGPSDIDRHIKSEALQKGLISHSDMKHYDMAFLKLNIRDKMLGSQVLPCRSGPSVVKVLLFQWGEA